MSAERLGQEEQGTSLEIERKFRVKELPGDLTQYPSEEISQVYTQISDDGIEIRFRKKGKKYLKTIKSGRGLVRDEEEVPITEGEFQEACKSAVGQRIDKTRYIIASEKGKFELDVYHGALDGLRIVEVEFRSEVESRSFQPPEWFGEEVTEDYRFKNQSLAVNGLP